jgi:methylated-DNA-protein-cysteine methyltransferase related protein
MGDFFQKVFQVVAAIPPGHVMTYGAVAAIAGNPMGARAVGYALCSRTAAGLHIPWHRVVNARGEISLRKTVNGDADRVLQRILLEGEGVVFSPSGRIPMDVYSVGGEAAGP